MVCMKAVKLKGRFVRFSTLGELVETPERIRCHLLVSKMPDAALHELEEELRETYEHYVSLASTAQLSALPPPSKAVTATVIEHVKT
jgi:hypothetical protein